MSRKHVAYALAASLVLGVSAIGVYHGHAAEAAGGAAPQLRPGLDDLMTMMVQPRHIKLYAPGQARNWNLAGFQLDELCASFRRIGQFLPKYRTYDMDNSVASIIAPAFAKVDAAIKARDSAQFASAFNEVTQGCNACHTAMEHALLIIKTPDASAMQPFINQDFVTVAK